MLIHVTSFFRDPEAFEALKEAALKEIVRSKTGGAPIRIWVPGCSTGEEVYAIAMCLVECLGEQGRDLSIKLFGSDLSDHVVEVARTAVYPEAALAAVSEARRARFFERIEGGYRISKRIRDLCIFVKHDVTRDPPFVKLDLVSCRNVLIYFDAELQRRILPMLHFCLGYPGYLFLGHSEAISGFRELFAPIDSDHRIFGKVGESSRIAYPLNAGREPEVKRAPGVAVDRHQPVAEAIRQADHLLLSRFAPPGVIVNERLEIVQFRGRTGAFLEPPPGQPEVHVLRMARHDLAAQLHEAIEAARTQGITVRRERVQISADGGRRLMDLEVVPLQGSAASRERFFLIVFQDLLADESEGGEAAARTGPRLPDSDEVQRLKVEIAATKDYLQSLVSDHKATSEDLAATNEELIASNEELQSSNEELQSAKEELQSTNEELNTLNDELRSRNAELDRVASDLTNVLASVEIPVIIVDLDLRVRRFTPTVRSIARFIPGDVGRPIDDLRLKLKVDDLDAKIRHVIEALEPKEWEVQGEHERWFRMQIRPYRTVDNRLDGAVLSFVDVDALKHAVQDAEGARDYARTIVDTVTTALVVLDKGLVVLSANHAFYEGFALPADAVGRSFFEVGARMWDLPEVRAALTEAVDKNVRFSGLEVVADMPEVGHKVLSLVVRPIRWAGDAPKFLLAINDITEVRTFETQRAQLLKSETQARLDAEQANRAKDLFLATLSHELRTPLSSLLIQAEMLRRLSAGDARIERASNVIARSASTQARIIEDLLDVSRIVSSKLMLNLGAVNITEVIQCAVDIARPAAEAKSVELAVDFEEGIGSLYGDPVRLQQVAANLLTNAIKFTPPSGRVSVSLMHVGDHVRLTVTDTGMGIPAEVMPHLFNKFVQADSSVTRAHGGLGLGLAIVRYLVEAHGGAVHAESAGTDQGATFCVTLPYGPAEPFTGRSLPPAVAHDIHGVRVLIVEDEDDMRESFAAVLQEFGAVVRAAPTAGDGLAAFDDFDPQVVLCDLAMPGEDGYSFIQKVRAKGPDRGGQVPVAALTAMASEEDRRRTLGAGFQMHLAKPVDASQLAAAVGILSNRVSSEHATA